MKLENVECECSSSSQDRARWLTSERQNFRVPRSPFEVLLRQKKAAHFSEGENCGDKPKL